MPDSPEVLIGRAARYYQARAYDPAARCALEILAQDPGHFDALHLLGVISLHKRQWADAVSNLTLAARRWPDHAQLQFNLGNALAELRMLPAAIAAYRRSLQLAPDDPGTLNNLATALRAAGTMTEAATMLEGVVTRWPDHAAAHFNLGATYEALDRWDDAIAHYRAALRVAPADTPAERFATMTAALGAALTETDQPEAALALCQAMRARFPDEPVLVWSAALAQLQLGQYEGGWRDYESRWLVPAHERLRPDARLPDPAAVAGQRVLLLGEQGRGDVLQFVRYAPLLAERGAIVSLSVTDDLKPLLTGMPAVTRVIGEDEREPEADILTPLLSLPLAFGTALATVPAAVPYLHPPADRVTAWRARLGPATGQRVGLVWASANPGARRSTQLAMLAPLLDLPGMTFHALQREIAADDLAFLRRDGRVIDHRAALTDFAETAALIACLDLVITIDSAVAHLAGAMGRPVWVMLPYVAEWRWLRSRSDSPWYPTARLFRQPARGDWRGLVRAVCLALDQRPR